MIYSVISLSYLAACEDQRGESTMIDWLLITLLAKLSSWDMRVFSRLGRVQKVMIDREIWEQYDHRGIKYFMFILPLWIRLYDNIYQIDRNIGGMISSFSRIMNTTEREDINKLSMMSVFNGWNNSMVMFWACLILQQSQYKC